MPKKIVISIENCTELVYYVKYKNYSKMTREFKRIFDAKKIKL